MEVQFYHLLTTSLERALPRLMEKALEGDYRVLIKCADASMTKMLDDHLWSYDPGSFLPHAIKNKGDSAQQPILLSTEIDRANQANLLVITDGTEVNGNAEGFTRVLDVFNGNDGASVTAARQRWKAYKERGDTLSYIRQQPNGGWKVEARTEEAAA